MRSRKSTLAISTFSMLNLLLTQVAASEGINNVHLAWMTERDRAESVGSMLRSGVVSVRTAVVPPLQKSVSAIHDLALGEQSVDAVIGLSWPVFIARDAKMRPGRSNFHAVASLSEMDVLHLRASFELVLRELDQRGIRLAAIEFGNEINWAGFNGDLAVPEPKGKPKPQAPSIAALERPEAYREGLRRYVAALAVVKELRDASAYNRDAKIISAGLAFMTPAFAAEVGAEYVDPNETIDYLKSLGMDQYVDGYGVHMYPELSKPKEHNARELDRLISRCSAAPQGKPCWLTEWGVPAPVDICPSDESRRLPVIRYMRELIEARAREGRIAGAYYFDWSGTKEPYAIWRCGGLTESGRALLEPRSGDTGR